MGRHAVLETAEQASPTLMLSAGSSARKARLDASSSRFIAMGGAAVGAIWVTNEAIRGPRPFSWWVAAQLLEFALLCVLALAPRWLTAARIRSMWVLIPVLGAFLQLTSYRHLPAGPIWEDSWMLTGVYLCLLVLWFGGEGHELLRVNVFAAVFACLPAVSAWLVLGHLTSEMVGVTATQFTNVGYGMLFVLFRRRMHTYYARQDRLHRRTIAAAAAEARLDEQRALARLAHDRVLGTLSAAALWDGPPPGELTAAARESLDLLQARSAASAAEQSSLEVQRMIAGLGADLDPACVISLGPASGTVPTACAVVLVDACHEALRNSVRHAPDARRHLAVAVTPDEVEVVVTDGGPGFDFGAIPADRLGVSESILGRMRDLPGGSADIDTSPDTGTRVRLHWIRSSA